MIRREEIIAEIQRCAAENDGEPLGRNRFEAETGIREHEWSGRYWTRWSDALIEAGFQPFELNPAIPMDELLGHLALAVRDLGRFPTVAEIKMRRRTIDGFPSANTFDRIGNKSERMSALRSFCSERPDWHDVSEILGPEPAVRSEPPATSNPAVVGVVYLMKSGKHYKIGRTNSLGRREYELAIQLPEKVETVHSIETDDPEGIEAYWHRRFAGKRTNGEWFLLDREDVAAFKRRRRYM